MSSLIHAINNKRQDILIGEIGALLHDIGKLHPDFVGKNSIENTPLHFNHAGIDAFLDTTLINLITDRCFEININGKTTDIFSLITKHHGSSSSDIIVEYLKSCDRLDSADDKGIVRKKQSVENTIIASPFGYPKEKIDLTCLQKRLEDLQNNLKNLFNDYINQKKNLSCFRKSIINNLKTTFFHGLGETRIPANDVTLWDHSHSTASLFKSILCAMVVGEDPKPGDLQWRIFGFCWDGIGFINKGRKIADILQRVNIIEEIKNKLKNKFEDETPIGNAIYEDNNGIYFTFPGLDDKNKLDELARECAKIGLEIICNKSKDEIWPLFTLSKPSRTLTILANKLKFASGKRKIPKITPTLFVEGNGKVISANPKMPALEKGKDICPVCKFRAKPEER